MKECGVKPIKTKVYIEDELFFALKRTMEKQTGGINPTISRVHTFYSFFHLQFISETSQKKST